MQQMPWFKWWGGTCGDPKLRMLAEDVKVPVASVIAIWAYLLEKASTAPERGVIPKDLDVLLMAYTLQMQPLDIEMVRNGMERLSIVTSRGEIAKWDDRQAKREKAEPSGASTERVRKMRERQKQQQNKDLGDSVQSTAAVTDVTGETACNGKERHKKKSREEEDKVKPKPSSSSGDDGNGAAKPFDQFWLAYPHKVAKIEAHKAWTKIKPDAELLALILTAIAAQKDGALWRREDGEFIPHPATWLRAGRWLDVVRPYVEPPKKLPPGWWETKEGMAAAGLMLTPPLSPRPGEYPKDFAQRIRDAVAGGSGGAPGGDPVAVDPVIAAATEMLPAPPDTVLLTDEQRDARRQELKEAMAKMRQKSGQAGVPGD